MTTTQNQTCDWCNSSSLHGDECLDCGRLSNNSTNNYTNNNDEDSDE